MDTAKLAQEREATARAVLAEIAIGTIPLERFAPGSRWWWNGGLDMPVEDFAALLATLHAQTADGIAIRPGLVLAQADSVVIEATTRSPLKDGRIYDNRYLFLIHFRGEHVAEVREYSDSAHVLATFDLSGI